MCWECPAMSGPVPTCDFTSPGVSQASCANQQFIHGSESGCAQDRGCTNSNKASIQTCIFCHQLSQTYCSSCCAGKDISDAATQSRVVCVSRRALLWASWGMKAIPSAELFGGTHTTQRPSGGCHCCWEWHRAQDR